VDAIRFAGTILHWDPGKESVLAVVDIPAEHVPVLGGFTQQRVRGSLGGAEFASNVMSASSGRLALSVSKAMMAASHLAAGDEADVEVNGAGRD